MIALAVFAPIHQLLIFGNDNRFFNECDLLKGFCFTVNEVELLRSSCCWQSGQFVSSSLTISSMSSGVMGVRRCCLCPGCAPFFLLVFLSFFSVFGLTISEEGGLEELPECFSSSAMRSLSRSISSRRFLIIPSSSAIRLSLASMMLRILFFPC